MKFLNVYHVGGAVEFLYDMLRQRTPEQSISHRGMPSFDEHRRFVASTPYPFWCIIEVDNAWVGVIYLTHNREIGIFIHSDHRGNGYGRQAIELMREYIPGPILANINPNNVRSRTLFEKLGGKMIQVTYELAE